MKISSTMPAAVVVDASVAIWALLPALAPVDAVGYLVAWREADSDIYAPSLWLAECVSAIRRYAHAGMITSQEGLWALDDLFALDVEVIPITPSHCRASYVWAERLGHSRAYDGFYLALTDELNATFYTGDRRLANGAQRLNIPWVHWIGDG